MKNLEISCMVSKLKIVCICIIPGAYGGFSVKSWINIRMFSTNKKRFFTVRGKCSFFDVKVLGAPDSDACCPD